jgi:hypothetical protein
MTPDERKMLEDLADKFSKTPSPPKDPEAEEFIRSRIGSRPDALYLMTQTVLIQNLALQQAQQQLRDLQQRSGQPAQVAAGPLGLQAGIPANSSTLLRLLSTRRPLRSTRLRQMQVAVRPVSSAARPRLPPA